MRSLVNFVRMCDTLNLFVIKWCGRFATLLLTVLACTMFCGVVFRLALNSPFSWTDEFSKYCMVWLTFIGAPVVMVRASHVTVDMLHQYLPPRVLHLLRLLIAVFCGVILALFVRYGWSAALSARHQSIVIMNNLSMFWVYVSIPLGSAIFLFAQMVNVLKELISFCNPELEDALSSQE